MRPRFSIEAPVRLGAHARQRAFEHLEVPADASQPLVHFTRTGRAFHEGSAAAARQLDQLNLKPRVRHPQLRPAPPDLLESEGRQLL